MSRRPPARVLRVGRASAGFVRRGHPWIRPDRFTRGLDGLRPGEPVVLEDETGRRLGLALADPGAPVCARVCAADDHWDAAAAADAAWQRRAALHADPATDCYRVVHGEADGLPGLRVDRFGPCLSAVVSAACILPWLDGALAALTARLPGCRVVVHEHLGDLRRCPVRSRLPAAARPDEEIDGRELGVTYALRPFAGIAAGLYVDQRANRRWLARRAAGRRVLNLFAYTGAFSLALLAAGAAEAVDVDVAAPALARAEAAAQRNRLVGHRTVRSDARAFCAADADLYDVVVIDPPTSAQGAGGGWLVRRDYPELLALAWRRVAPGGLLLATCNAIGAPFPLHRALREACSGGRDIEPPPLDPDVPQSAGFPEGRPFRAAAMLRP